MEQRPQVGVGAIVIKEGKVLLGKRKNSHGDGTWSFPGGHLEYGESWETCAKREVLEEVGIDIKNVVFGTVTNDIFKREQKHYITIFMISDYNGGTVTNMEPDKCEEWQWFDWNNIPEPRFIPISNLLKTGFSPMGLD